MRKAQANTFWIVIGAVLALVVLVVLMLIFTGKTNVLEQGLLECSGKGGECVSSESDCLNADGSDGTISTAFECTGDDAGKKCCFKS